MLRLPVLFTLALFATPGNALSLDTTPVPGGIAVIPLPANADPATARYRDKKVLITKTDDKLVAVIGLPLASKPGRHYLQVKDKQGKTQSLGFQVIEVARAAQAGKSLSEVMEIANRVKQNVTTGGQE